ncbi:uncharacterized protein LOC131692483 [Topomyia yanbarensis]|uniref:uncharacterized protein LOC131692483 n=1 Tax=Topomyia yanbarensis TaxID=2498891 RepID=UPI00273BD4D1|nr:uncharacterized protein LOC131692483 [Topomyia yanbarensis]
MSRSGIIAAATVLLTIGLAGQIIAADKGKQSPGQAYLGSIPPNYVDMFVRYHLDKALEQRIPNHVSTPPTDIFFHVFLQLFPAPKDFANNLLHLVEDIFGLTDEDVERILRSGETVCTPEGLCFNPGDVGTICCPF